MGDENGLLCFFPLKTVMTANDTASRLSRGVGADLPAFPAYVVSDPGLVTRLAATAGGSYEEGPVCVVIPLFDPNLPLSLIESLAGAYVRSLGQGTADTPPTHARIVRNAGLVGDVLDHLRRRGWTTH